jgi:hypothetical protein
MENERVREIKFRAYNKYWKRIMEPWETCKVPLINCNGETYDFHYGDCPHESYYGKDKHYVLMQWIGRKDKNGNDIYEKDIVRGEGFIGLVIWRAQTNAFDVTIPVGLGIYEEGLLWETDKVEVIGNLYENPELLEYTAKNPVSPNSEGE